MCIVLVEIVIDFYVLYGNEKFITFRTSLYIQTAHLLYIYSNMISDYPIQHCIRSTYIRVYCFVHKSTTQYR